MELSKLRARLVNWGYWCNHEAQVGPKGARCISLESKHVPEAGDVWDDAEPDMPTPNVADAEALHAHIRELDCLQQYCLAVTYAGTPTVMRWRRVGEHVMQHSVEAAELLLYEAMKRRA